MTFENPNPECIRKDCRFEPDDYNITTLAYYPPIYDKNGVNVNLDGNKTYSGITCTTCGKRWSSVTQYGKTEYTLIK